MFEQDYLMRQLLAFFQALARSWEMKEEDDDPALAAETLENAISSAVDMDGGILLSLAPESIASVMRVSGIDPQVTRYIAHGLLLESVYLSDAGDEALAHVRAGQARAIAREYGFELPDDPSDFEALSEGLDELSVSGFSDVLWDDFSVDSDELGY